MLHGCHGKHTIAHRRHNAADHRLLLMLNGHALRNLLGLGFRLLRRRWRRLLLLVWRRAAARVLQLHRELIDACVEGAHAID